MGEQVEAKSLGQHLREIRKARRITGSELAATLGVTQGTVSKMETGRLSPDVDYLSRFAHVLQLEPTKAAELMHLAGVVPDGATPESFLRFVPCDFVTLNWAERRQDACRQAEQNSHRIRVFQPLLVPGLLQTEGYAREVFLRAGERSVSAIDRAVLSRLQRQRILNDARRNTCFLVSEAALRCRLVPPDVLAGQYEHLCHVIEGSQVRLGILPLECGMPVPCPPGFYVFDDRVYIELPHGDLWLFGSAGAQGTYDKLFSTLVDAAVFGEVAQRILARLGSKLLHC